MGTTDVAGLRSLLSFTLSPPRRHLSHAWLHCLAGRSTSPPQRKVRLLPVNPLRRKPRPPAVKVRNQHQPPRSRYECFRIYTAAVVAHSIPSLARSRNLNRRLLPPKRSRPRLQPVSPKAQKWTRRRKPQRPPCKPRPFESAKRTPLSSATTVLLRHPHHRKSPAPQRSIRDKMRSTRQPARPRWRSRSVVASDRLCRAPAALRTMCPL